MKWLLILAAFFFHLSAKECHAPVDTVIYQPLNKDFDHYDWQQIMEKLDNACIKRVIMQWSSYGDDNLIASHPEWLPTVFKEAKKREMKIVLGLYANPNFFKQIEDPNFNRKACASRFFERNRKLINYIKEEVPLNSAFEGWYLYPEIDDLHWQSESDQDLLRNIITTMTTIFKASTPNAKLYISGFYGGNMEMHDYATLWSNTLNEHWTLLVQSGIGAGLLSIEEAALFYDTFAQAYHQPWQAIAEGFIIQQQELKPMPYPKLHEQIVMLQNQSKNAKLALFSLRYLLSEPLYEEYLRTINP